MAGGRKGAAKATHSVEPTTLITAGVVAALIGRDERRVRQLTHDGVFRAAGNKSPTQYELGEVFRAWAEYRERLAAKKAERQTERADYEFERARKLKLENDEREGHLIDTELGVAAVDVLVGMIRTELAGVPARISEDVALRRRAEDAIDTILRSLAGRLEKAVEALRAGRDPLSAVDALAP